MGSIVFTVAAVERNVDEVVILAGDHQPVAEALVERAALQVERTGLLALHKPSRGRSTGAHTRRSRYG